MFHHLKNLSGKFDSKKNEINQPILIRNIMVYPERHIESQGEAQKHNNIYQRYSLMTRLIDQIKLYAYLAKEYHKQYNYNKNQEGTYSLKQNSSNKITRLLLSEFSLYPDKPLTMGNFSLLIEEIERIASDDELQNIHLFLSSISVITDEGYTSVVLFNENEIIRGYSRIVILPEQDQLPDERNPDTLYLQQENNLLCVYPFQNEPTILSPESSAEVCQAILYRGQTKPSEPIIETSTKSEPTFLFEHQIEIKDFHVVKTLTALCGYHYRSSDTLYIRHVVDKDKNDTILVYPFNEEPRILSKNKANKLYQFLREKNYGFDNTSDKEIEEFRVIKKVAELCDCSPGVSQVLNTTVYVQCGRKHKIDVFCKTRAARQDINYPDSSLFSKSSSSTPAANQFANDVIEYFTSPSGTVISGNTVFNVKLPSGAEYTQTVDICVCHKYNDSLDLLNEQLNVKVTKNTLMVPGQGDMILSSDTFSSNKGAQTFETIVHIDPHCDIAKSISNDVVTFDELNNSREMENLKKKYSDISLNKIEECHDIILLDESGNPPNIIKPNTLYLKPGKPLYDILLKSINSFIDFDTSSLEKFPCLIKDKKGKCQLWGRLNNNWQLRDMGNFIMPRSWINERVIDLSPNTLNFKKLEKGHTFDKNMEYRIITVFSCDKTPDTLSKRVSIELGKQLAQEGYDLGNAQINITEDKVIKKILPLCGREGFRIENPPFGSHFRIVATNEKILSKLSDKLQHNFQEREKKLKYYFWQSQLAKTPQGQELIHKVDKILKALDKLYLTLEEASKPTFEEKMMEDLNYQKKIAAKEIIKASHEKFLKKLEKKMPQFVTSVYLFLDSLKQQLQLSDSQLNLIAIVDETMKNIKDIQGGEENITIIKKEIINNK